MEQSNILWTLNSLHSSSQSVCAACGLMLYYECTDRTNTSNTTDSIYQSWLGGRSEYIYLSNSVLLLCCSVNYMYIERERWTINIKDFIDYIYYQIIHCLLRLNLPYIADCYVEDYVKREIFYTCDLGRLEMGSFNRIKKSFWLTPKYFKFSDFWLCATCFQFHYHSLSRDFLMNLMNPPLMNGERMSFYSILLPVSQ